MPETDPLASIAPLQSPLQAQLQRLAIAPSQIEAAGLVLTSSQHHYLCRVLRLRPGDRFIALDGRGSAWLAELADADGLAIADLVSTLHDGEHEANAAVFQTVTLLMAMPKQGMDEVVRQSTELGVTEVQPIVSDRTILKPSAQKVERWRRIAAEAAEQSERLIIPTVAEPMKWADYLQLNGEESDQDAERSPHCYICVARGDVPNFLTCLHRESGWKTGGVTLAIGPEGGWTEAETERAIAHHFTPVSLGQSILRAVTAPIAALSLIMAARELESTR
ncbi:MAG: 16S rRNA (uracil(1498)-N(3))-methyltransferase [Elainellaceae cyanobacterium]